MSRLCWWIRSPYMLLNCWPIVIFAQSILYCQDYTFNGCSGGANGCEKSAKCAGERKGRCGGRVRVRRGQVVVVCAGWGRKWVRLVFLFHGSDAGGAARGGTAGIRAMKQK